MNVTLYTDASWSPRSLIGGWAVWYRNDILTGRTAHGAFKEPMPHVDFCELGAIVNGVHILRKNGLLTKATLLVIVTDSLNAKRMIEEPREEIGEALLHTLTNSVAECRINHVKAHTGRENCRRTYVNDVVDQLSKRARIEAEYARQQNNIKNKLTVGK